MEPLVSSLLWGLREDKGQPGLQLRGGGSIEPLG